MTHNVIVIEDHYFVRSAIEIFLKELNIGINVIGSSNLNESLLFLKNISYPIKIISDLDLTDSRGVNTVKSILEINENFEILVFSAHDDIELQSYLKKIGVKGFLNKNKSVYDVKNSLKLFLRGESIFDPIVSLTSCENLETMEKRIRSLSGRQIAILKEFSYGVPLSTIANNRKISEVTLQQYLSEIVSKMKCKNRYDVIRSFRNLEKFGFVN